MDSMYIVTFQVSKQHLSLNIFTSFFVFGEDFQVDQTNIFEDSDMFFSPKKATHLGSQAQIQGFNSGLRFLEFLGGILVGFFLLSPKKQPSWGGR